MEPRYIFGDIIEMLKVITDNPEKQEKVSCFLRDMPGGNAADKTCDISDYENVIPRSILEMLIPIKDDKNKLLKVLNFLENEIIAKKEDKDEREAVDEYKNIVPQIIEAMDNGFIVYLNPETLEMEQVQDDTIYNMEEFQEQNDDLLDEFQMDYMKWDGYIKFEPLGPDDLATMVEDFIRGLDDIQLANKLEDVITIEESYEDFLGIINSSDKYQEKWNNFKNKATENYVRNQLIGELKNIEREIPAERVN